MYFEDLISNTEIKEMDINLRLVKVDGKLIILNQSSLNKEELNETKEASDLLIEVMKGEFYPAKF